MGVVVDPPVWFRDAHRGQQFHGPSQRFTARAPAVHAEGFGNLVAHRKHRVEGGRGLLNDQRDLRAADATHLLLRQPQEVAPAERNRAADDTARTLNQSENR